VTGKLVRQRGVGLTRIDQTKTAAGGRTIPLPSFASSSGTLRDPENFNGAWRAVRDDLGMPDVTSHSFGKTVAMLIDDAGLSARIGADHLGHAKVSMTQDRYMSRGRVHAQVADLLDRAVTDLSDE
jgi:integrase